MCPDGENSSGFFFGLKPKYDFVNRFGLLFAIRRPYVEPLEHLLLFDEGDRLQDFPLSPERRVYLSQLQRMQNDPVVASKRVPFCDAKLGDSVPRWKMAILTWIGVCVTVGVLGFLIGPWTANWSWFTNLLFFNAAVVLLLTWLVMPVLIWFAEAWLQS